MKPPKRNYFSNVLINHWPLILILLLSFAAKIAFHLIFYRNLDYWQSGYRFYYQMAQNFLREGRLYVHGTSLNPAPIKSFALRSPLYPLFIAAFLKWVKGSTFLFITAQALISTLTVLMVYKITSTVANKAAAILAAALCAFYPYSFVHDIQLQENSLYNCLSLVSLWYLAVAVDKKKNSLFLLTGILLGLTTLTRASHALHTIFLIALLFSTFRKNWKQAVLFTGTLTLSFFLCLSPWLMRNKKVAGSFTITSAQGFALAIAHHESTFLYYPYKGSIDNVHRYFHSNLTQKEKNELEGLADNEMARSRWFRSRAIRYMLDHKLETLWQGFTKAAVNFLGVLSPLQNPLKNTAYFLSYWTLTFLAIKSLPLTGKTFFFQAFVFMSLSQAVSSFIFWAHTSHRSFLDPMLAVLAGIGLARWLRIVPTQWGKPRFT